MPTGWSRFSGGSCRKPSSDGNFLHSLAAAGLSFPNGVGSRFFRLVKKNGSRPLFSQELTMRRWLTPVLVALAVTTGGGRDGLHARSKTAPDPDKTIVHVLNRIAFGPRPGDVARVRAMGIEKYIDEQLRPERIDDAGMNARLAGLTTLTMSSREIARKFEMPVIEARREKRDSKNGDAAEPGPEQKMIQQQANRVVVELGEQKLLRAIYSERQLQEVLTDFWFNHFNVDARKGPDRFMLTEYERDAIRPHVLGK